VYTVRIKASAAGPYLVQVRNRGTYALEAFSIPLKDRWIIKAEKRTCADIDPSHREFRHG
jgi:hypothetical protein